jgi:hypothetical protein
MVGFEVTPEAQRSAQPRSCRTPVRPQVAPSCARPHWSRRAVCCMAWPSESCFRRSVLAEQRSVADIPPHHRHTSVASLLHDGVRTGYGQNWYIEQRLARQARQVLKYQQSARAGARICCSRDAGSVGSQDTELPSFISQCPNFGRILSIPRLEVLTFKTCCK